MGLKDVFSHNEQGFRRIFIWAETCETIFEIEKTGFAPYSSTGGWSP